MVFLPMPAYGLFKLLLNIDSGYTLIVLTLISFFKMKETSVSLSVIPHKKNSACERLSCT